MSLGNLAAGALLNHQFMNAALTQPTNIFVSLHTGNPGEDGQTANEVSTSGTAYARFSTDGTYWANATNADPAVILNALAIAFAVATGAGFGTVTHVGLWLHLTSTAEANYIGMYTLSSSKTIAAGDTISFAASALAFSLD